jgi:hypothetical protein
VRPDFYSGSAHKWECGPKNDATDIERAITAVDRYRREGV